MEYYLDNLIPVVILAAVGAFLVYLVRRAARERDAVPPSAAVPLPVNLNKIVVVPLPTPEPLQCSEEKAVVESMIVARPAVDESAKPRRKKRVVPVPLKVADDVTPIEAVLGLLKKKESLAAAFLLHEILAPPVSKRIERAAQARK